ncbi:MAG: 23S rRNA (adenine(2503)-C2)-methyltransferase, partial [Spirochaetaceae bacterium]|nr:23S rRNA (adenine(2503)-C2)-methyltransferase [Spirochaetaceae bacterium]
INTRNKDIDALTAFSKDLDVVVNLIPWNRVEKLLFENKPLTIPSIKEIKQFADALNQNGIKTVFRHKKGGEISGACGQLGFVKTQNVSRETI